MKIINVTDPTDGWLLWDETEMPVFRETKNLITFLHFLVSPSTENVVLHDLDGMGGAVSAVGPNGSLSTFSFGSRIEMKKHDKEILCHSLKDHPEKLVKPRRNVVFDTLSAYLRVS